MGRSQNKNNLGLVKKSGRVGVILGLSLLFATTADTAAKVPSSGVISVRITGLPKGASPNLLFAGKTRGAFKIRKKIVSKRAIIRQLPPGRFRIDARPVFYGLNYLPVPKWQLITLTKRRLKRRVTVRYANLGSLRFNLSDAGGLAVTEKSLGATRQLGSESPQSNLLAILTDGELRNAIVSGSAVTQSVAVGPAGQLAVSFKQGVANCLLAVVDRVSGIPTCVDPALVGFLTHNRGQLVNPSVQFDGQGNLYYLGFIDSDDGPMREVPDLRLRRWTPNGLVSDLFVPRNGASVGDFLVLPDGNSFLYGRSGPGELWVRRVSPTGGLQTLIDGDANYLASFSDGNAYFGLTYFPAETGVGGILRFNTGQGALDSQPWLSNSGQPVLLGSSLCPTPSAPFSMFCTDPAPGSSPSSLVETASGEALLVIGGFLYQVYPALKGFTTTFNQITVAEASSSKVFLAGKDRNGKYVLSALDLTSGVLSPLIGPENETEIFHITELETQRKILFDGLRFSDNSYIYGEVDLRDLQVTVSLAPGGRWEDLVGLD